MRNLLMISLSFLLIACKVKEAKSGIAVIYKAEPVESEKACDLKLTLDEVKKTYLFSGAVSAKGSYVITRGDDDNIVFRGLNYAEYNDGMESAPQVEGLLLQDTIVIQNYGNSMNEYMKISGCEEKYIYLVKQK